MGDDRASNDYVFSGVNNSINPKRKIVKRATRNRLNYRSLDANEAKKILK